MSEITAPNSEWFFPIKPEIKFSGMLNIDKENKIVLEVLCPINIIVEIFFPDKNKNAYCFYSVIFAIIDYNI
jgi:hypothetical protein